MEKYKGISSHPHSPPSPTERKMMSTQSIRRRCLQKHLWEQGEGCGKEDGQMATEGTWSLSPTEEEIFSSSTEALIMERKQLRQQSSPLHVALVKCQKHFTEVHISMGGNGTSNIWSMEVRQRCRSSWPRTQEAAVCRDVSRVEGRGGMGLWLGARAWKTAD